MNSKIERIKEIAAELREMIPSRMQLTVTSYGYDVSLHDVSTAEATTIMREFGVADREKSNIQNEFMVLRGMSEGVEFTAYLNDLPATCHRVIVKERIPKKQTVETGDFIEVDRVKIVCTGAEGGAK